MENEEKQHAEIKIGQTLWNGGLLKLKGRQQMEIDKIDKELEERRPPISFGKADNPDNGKIRDYGPSTDMIATDAGLRHNKGKIRYDLMEPFAIEELAKVFTKGAEKYAPNNWLKGLPWMEVVASLERHVAEFKRGEDFDEETGLYHMAHAAWNALALVSYYKHRPEFDNRYKKAIKKIGLDIDEVICDFTAGWGELHGITQRPEHWNYHREMGIHFKKMREDNALNDFYLTLKPRIDPKEIPFEPHCYVTSRPVPTEVTEKWLDMHGFPTSKVITVPVDGSKVQAMKDAGVEVFVDDKYENYEELNRNGILCYLWDSPHNQRYNVGYKRIKSLKELI